VKPAILVTILLVGLTYPSIGQPAQDNKAIVALQSELIQSLTKSDTTGFLSLVSPSGVSFGVDGDRESKDQILAQFNRKEGAYCVLFDSKCLLRKAGSKSDSNVCSVRDLVSGTNQWSIEHRTGQHEGMSQIYLTLKPNNESCSNGRHPIDFVFTRFVEGWKLVAVPYT